VEERRSPWATPQEPRPRPSSLDAASKHTTARPPLVGLQTGSTRAAIWPWSWTQKLNENRGKHTAQAQAKIKRKPENPEIRVRSTRTCPNQGNASASGQPIQGQITTTRARHVLHSVGGAVRDGPPGTSTSRTAWATPYHHKGHSYRHVRGTPQKAASGPLHIRSDSESIANLLGGDQPVAPTSGQHTSQYLPEE